MLEWFIVAFIELPNSINTDIMKMQKSFASRSACIKYLKETPEIINDITEFRPTNTGMRFQCLSINEIDKLDKKKYSIKREKNVHKQ